MLKLNFSYAEKSLKFARAMMAQMTALIEVECFGKRKLFEALSQRLFTCLIASICFFSGVPSSTVYAQNEPVRSEKITIGFYNIENLFDTVDDPAVIDEEFLPNGLNAWTEERYRIKLDNMARVISGFRPDVLGLCEIENRQVLKDLINHPALRPMGYQIAHFDMNDARGVDVAFIYRPQVFRPFRMIRLPIRDPEEPGFRTRDVLWAKGLVFGDTLHFAVNHWPSRRGIKEDKRLIAASVVRNAVDSVFRSNASAKIIIVGDLNDDPSNRSIRKILMAGDDKARSGILLNLAEPTYRKGYGTLAYDGVWNLFDQIIISRPLTEPGRVQAVPESFSIFAPKWMQEETGTFKGMPKRTFRSGVFNPEGYSDHFPVFFQLNIQKTTQ